MKLRILGPLSSPEYGVVDVVLDRGGRRTATWFPGASDGAGRGQVAWGVLRPGEVQRREFALEEAALRADARVMSFEAAQHLGSGVADTVWSVRPQAVQGGRVRAELRSVALDVAERAGGRADAMGVVLERLLDPADVIEAAWREDCGAVVEPSLVLVVGARESVVLWLDDGARRVRSLPLGGRTTADEVMARQPPQGPAERVTEEAAQATRSRLHEETTATLAARAHLELSRLLSLAGSESTARPARPARVWVRGEGASTEFAALLSARLGLPVQLWVSTVPAAAWITEPPPDWRSAWEVDLAGGVALQRGGAALVAANFLPPARSRRLARRVAQVTLLGAAALVSVAALPPAWHYHRLASETAERVRQLGAEVERLQRLDAENRAALRRLDAERARVEALHALAAARLRWPQFLGGLELCLERVEDAWLDGLHPTADATAPGTGELRVRVTGGLLAAESVGSEGSLGELEAEPRVRTLLAQVAGLPSIARIERERFSRAEPGMLRFDLELALVPEALE